jgi:molybdopterin synthase catalytic subunit
MQQPDASVPVFLEVTAEPLSLDRCVAAVADDGAGAIASFIGVTRNTFEGKRVLRLEYEAYTPMARARIRLPSSTHAASR